MKNDILEPAFWSLRKLFKYKYVVPVYQRPYSWQKEEVKSILNDIYASFKDYSLMNEDDRRASGLYVGNIILHQHGIETYDIIDGQQRITTFAMILLALYSKLKAAKYDSNNRVVLRIQECLWELDGMDNPRKDERAIKLGSIDKEILIKIFDYAYSSPEKLGEYVDHYETDSSLEKNIKKDYKLIEEFLDDNIRCNKDDQNTLLLFANFFIKNVWLIAIINNSSEQKAFSIFESINSKGKKLEDIDLIKTHIFSNLEEKEYSQYLSKWGELIKKTNDNLYDYLKVYIKAFIKFYSSNISYKNFNKMDSEFIRYFGVKNIDQAFRSLIDDMIAKVNFYKAVNDVDLAYKFLGSHELRFYHLLFTKIGYEHPKPLFFRCFCEFADGKITKDVILSVMINIIKMMISYLTICQKDSKDIIPIFINIFDNVFSKGKIEKDSVLYEIDKGLSSGGIRRILLNSLCNLDMYSKNKKLGSAILSIYDSKYIDKNNNSKISWDEAYSKLLTFGTSYSLDHIMAKMPAINDKNLKYYKLGNSLKLKEGNDFPRDTIYEGMEYDDFEKLVLNLVGNLKLKGRDSNSSKGNTSQQKFSTYKVMKKRTEDISNFILDNCLKIPKPSILFTRDDTGKTRRKKISGNFDLSMKDLNLTGVKVKSVSIDGDEKKIRSNKDIIKELLLYLFEKDKSKLILMARNNWSYKKRVLISNNKEDMKCPYELLANSIYIETNLSSVDIIDFAREVLKEFQIPSNTISVFIPE